ncbi:MAG: hypothetical protein FWF57_01780 [Defluviitaleaceae bacterium]|nr:hypothetical protein [Defluviitaleaceae bacterium]
MNFLAILGIGYSVVTDTVHKLGHSVIVYRVRPTNELTTNLFNWSKENRKDFSISKMLNYIYYRKIDLEKFI